jgi:arsenate reductase
MVTKPAVLFVCTHNAGRSQMAMGFFKHLAGEQATVYSGGSEPAGEINPAAVAAMSEKGIDIAAEQPKRWSRSMRYDRSATRLSSASECFSTS